MRRTLLAILLFAAAIAASASDQVQVSAEWDAATQEQVQAAVQQESLQGALVQEMGPVYEAIGLPPDSGAVAAVDGRLRSSSSPMQPPSGPAPPPPAAPAPSPASSSSGDGADGLVIAAVVLAAVALGGVGLWLYSRRSGSKPASPAPVIPYRLLPQQDPIYKPAPQQDPIYKPPPRQEPTAPDWPDSGGDQVVRIVMNRGSR